LSFSTPLIDFLPRVVEFIGYFQVDLITRLTRLSSAFIVPSNVLLIVPIVSINSCLLLGVLYNALRCVSKSVNLALAF